MVYFPPMKDHPANEIAAIPQGLNALEFFAGIGLMRLGLERAGWSVSFANDIDAGKARMYQDHFGSGERFVLGDIHGLAAEDLPTSMLATASFPCNDLSLAGMRGGLGGKQSSAYYGFVRLLKEMQSRRPPIVLLENVAGFLSSRNGADFADALVALNTLGYSVDALMLDAAWFVPQSRVRLFVIGFLDESLAAEAPKETDGFQESAIRPRALGNFIADHPEIRWRMRGVSPPPRKAPPLSSILEHAEDGSLDWWSEKRTNYLMNQMSERHRTVLSHMMNARQWSYGAVFRRVRNGRSMAELRTDGVAGCLRTPRGGSGRQILVKAGFGQIQVRLLSPRECARLMGADDFTIRTSRNQALFGFGDGVCVPVIEWLARNYLNKLAEEVLAVRQEFRKSA